MADVATWMGRKASYVVIPGAGSAGLAWAAVVADLGAALLAVPDEPEVAAMAAALAGRIEAAPRPRVVAGASLGAMVALEVARTVDVDALVLLAAGFGIHVGDSVLDLAGSGAPDLFARMARAGLADRDDVAHVETVVRDFELRGPGVLHRHLRALASYRPEPLSAPPPTLVLWGERDRSVPLADHAELALRCDGILVPIRGAGHRPFLERPRETALSIRDAARLAALAFRAKPAEAAP